MPAKPQKADEEKTFRSAPVTEILGINVPHCSVDALKEQTEKFASSYTEAIGRTDRALYALLETVYQQYLLAQVDDSHQSHVNSKVRSALEAAKKAEPGFDIRTQQEQNRFSKLLAVMIPSAMKVRLNHEPFHLPKADSTHALAMQWAFRNKWSPSRFYEELCATGVREMRDQEKKKRAERPTNTVVAPPISIDAAIKELGSYSTLRQAPIKLEDAGALSPGLTLMLANVQAEEHGAQLQLLQALRVTPKQITALVHKEAKSIAIDRSEPAQLLRTLQIAFRMLDRVPPKNISITLETTELETFVCVAVHERTDKQWKFVISKAHGHPEPLDANLLLSMTGEHAKDLVATLAPEKGFNDWHFDTQPDKEAKAKGVDKERVSLIASVDAEQADSAEIECPLRDGSHIDTKPIPEEWKALFNTNGGALSYFAWNGFVEKEPTSPSNAGEDAADDAGNSSQKQMTWCEAVLGKSEVTLRERSAPAAKHEWKTVEGGTELPASVELTANIPGRLDALYEALRMDETKWGLTKNHLLVTGNARDIEYVIGFERKKVSEKAEAPPKPTSKRSKKSKS